jgi:hypothetical protein
MDRVDPHPDALIGIFLWIHRHYSRSGEQPLARKYGEPPPYNVRHRVIVPISNVHQGTLAALRYARMLSDDITAVHVLDGTGGYRKGPQEMGDVGTGDASRHRGFPLPPLPGTIAAITLTKFFQPTTQRDHHHRRTTFCPVKKIHNACTCRPPKCCGGNCSPPRAWSLPKSLIKSPRAIALEI